MKNAFNKKYNIEYLKNNIMILKNNEIYRVGDMFSFGMPKAVNRLLSDNCFKNTLLKKYFEKKSLLKINNKTTKLKLFYDIMKKFMIDNKITVYDDSYLVVHVRTGDDLKSRGLVKNSNIYLNIIKQYKNKKIVIVTAMHYGNSDLKNKLYMRKTWLYSDDSKNKNCELLHQLIKQIENPVYLCSNSDVDLDLIKLVFSKNVKVSSTAGRFAKVVQDLHNLYLNDKKFKILDEYLIK